MNKQRKAEQGSALVYMFGLCLVLSVVVGFFAERIKLNRMVIHWFEQEFILSQVAEDLTTLAMSQVLNNPADYDAPSHFIIPTEKIQALARGYQATVEIYDEGSRFNPNNLPVTFWEAYFRRVPEVYERLVEWYFPPTEASGNFTTPIRTNYLLTPAELAAVLTEDGKALFPVTRLTVFGPANYYLLDGEVFLSLLQRCGVQLSSLGVETIIERFNEQRGHLYNENLATLLGQLQLPEQPPLEKLEQLLTAKGSINPNFIEPAYLRLLMPEGQQREFTDLVVRQQEQPFSSLETFEAYLRNTHGVTISAELLRHLFSVQSRILGIRVLLHDQEGTLLLTVDTVVERGKAENEGAYTVISRRKKWGSGKEGKNE